LLGGEQTAGGHLLLKLLKQHGDFREFLLGVGNEHAVGEHEWGPAEAVLGVHLRAVIDQVLNWILVVEGLVKFAAVLRRSGGATVAENAVTAALREATEETGISKRLLEGAHIIPLGHRSYDRPFDIRVAWGDMPGTDIKKGDFFAVSTQAFCVKTPQALLRVSLKAGDDAKGVLVVRISDLAPEDFGVADHLAMIQTAQIAAHV